MDQHNPGLMDTDPEETDEWVQAFAAVLAVSGEERAEFLLHRLGEAARNLGVVASGAPFSAYRNTIGLDKQGPYPGDEAMEERLTGIIRWNALVMVMRANETYGEVGGHIASYASAAEIFEMGFNHFFRGSQQPGDGDLVFLQPHSAPGIYARAFLEGRLPEERLARYRQETGEHGGLCSYPHPWLMPNFWQFPTGSMGIGCISSIYQARFMRYLEHRGLRTNTHRHVWGVFGDGEMDEPESMAGLTFAARERLDNLTFVINCNLQRLDGPVRGNGQIIQELEGLFAGAGWNVIKVLWGSQWDELFARDTQHALLRRFAATTDGEYQTLGAKDGQYNLANFFNQDPELAALVSHMSDAEIDALKRGGHDFRKLFAAFAAAKAHKGAPTVILAKTKKGFGMGPAGESRMTSHQTKKLKAEGLLAFRDRFRLPLSDAAAEALEFYRPPQGSPELDYLMARRAELGGYLPQRQPSGSPVPVPDLNSYAQFALAADGKVMSTTMAVVRMLGALLKDAQLGPRVVPIVADEARTFGMASLFRQVGIYSAVGQLYEPEDVDSLMSYKEATDGQILEEGITEAGAISSWVAAATAYSAHGITMLPFYIYYSMFGFQRVGDLIWAAADQRARGFLLGATSGRTTLSGEGLQHQDGSSHVMAATVPNCRAYDPAYAYELAIIIDHGMHRMLEQQEDEFYYITVMNETYPQPSVPPGFDVSSVDRAAVVAGMYSLQPVDAAQVRLLGSGSLLPQVVIAAQLLQEDWQVAAQVWSVTSFTELARDAQEQTRWNRLHPTQSPRLSHIQKCWHAADASSGQALPVVAATDYVRAYPQLIAPHVEAPFAALGTDGFGRSDTREALRRFFEIDAQHIVVAALQLLAVQGSIAPEQVAQAVVQYQLDVDSLPPWQL